MIFDVSDKVECIKSTSSTEGYVVREGTLYTVTAILKHDPHFIAVDNVNGLFPSDCFRIVGFESPQLITGVSSLPATSASKNDKDKVDLSLIPRISNIEHAKAFMIGEKKYGRYNYTKGHKASQLVAAAKRHLDAWFEGEEHDPIDGQHHLGSVMACCSMILRQQELGTIKDDRFKEEANG